jgi:ketosteroid isomerase-like protein
MAAHKPEEVNPCLIEAINNGDVESALAMYETGAAFVTEEGTVTGSEAIRMVMESCIALKPKISIVAKETVQAGDIAVTRGNWSLTGTGPEGEALDMAGQSVEVVRRQADGTWLFVIDLPNGAED